MKNKKGFTILELLVVVAIIAILAVIAIPNFIGRIEQAKDSRELAEINAVTKAVSTYYADKGVYPTLQGKDGTLLQPQPIDGSPHNIDFSSLVPAYLASLPHFSYWWVDAQGKVYHTENTVVTVTFGLVTPTAGYTYTLYKTNGTTQALSAPYTLQAGEYVLGKDEKGVDLPKISAVFKNAKAHPEDPEYVAPVLFTSQTFDYTGSVQTFTVPSNGTYKLETWGAKGGNANSLSSTGYGGNGGYAKGELYLTAGQALYIYVGGSNAYNGGGPITSNEVGVGGGATDIRIGGMSLNDRKIVAGGGGGGGCAGSGARGNGGVGGGTNGIDGGSGYNCSGGGGGTQTAGGARGTGTLLGQAGSFGLGGTASVFASSFSASGAGGGGWYGGGSGGHSAGAGSGGGGGSSYVGTLTNTQTIAGNTAMPTSTTGTMVGNSGNGIAKITYVSP